ncbi:hypothetical protein VNTUMSATTG_61430 (plasmid) [Vibrio nigripulchritudo]|uniref:hypothetical protein n=1 Tax=Vibrio nigripulchritudo TaxID=28173 RepID=UPI0019094B96|nr:hypothetical protein [Vibrio nigripulchritudo]BCL74206.1 hypothetical protein VNTUMSATTG_61430 [Vibrio nigripulchritudo]
MEKLNADLTLDIECPVCEEVLPRRGLKPDEQRNIANNHTFVCPYCSEQIEIYIEKSVENE